MLNMAVNGFLSTLMVVIAGGDLNGPTIGGIFTIVGFSSTGKHIRNIFPIMMGVYPAGLTKYWSISEPSPCWPSCSLHSCAYFRRVWMAGRASGRLSPLLCSAQCGHCVRRNESL